jgi:hypothetical protein
MVAQPQFLPFGNLFLQDSNPLLWRAPASILNSINKTTPESMNEEDFDGLSPIEIAINGDTDADIVHTLRRASEEARRQAKQKRVHYMDLLGRQQK